VPAIIRGGPLTGACGSCGVGKSHQGEEQSANRSEEETPERKSGEVSGEQPAPTV